MTAATTNTAYLDAVATELGWTKVPATRDEAHRYERGTDRLQFELTPAGHRVWRAVVLIDGKTLRVLPFYQAKVDWFAGILAGNTL